VATYLADPADLLDYDIDYNAASTPWLAVGETITASTWTVPAGITSSSPSFTTTKTTIWLTGGTLDTVYTLTNHITTSAGRQRDQSFSVQIVNR